MKEWKTYKLGDIVNFTTGKLDSNAADINGKYPFFTCSPETLKINSFAFNQKAILLAGNNAEGNFSVKYYEGKFNAYQRTYVISISDENVVDYKFLYYALKICLLRFKMMSQGTSTKFLTKSILNSFEIDLPNIETQQSIASILASIDSKIQINRQINDNLEQQASNLFQDWLNNCENSIMLRELTDNVLDYTPNTHEHVYLLNSSDVTEGQFTVLPLTPNINLKGQFKKRFKKGDILYSEIRPRNRHYAYCYFDADKYIASTRLIVLRAKPEKLTSSILLYQYLMLNNVFEEFTLKTESRSGTFPQGNYEDLSSIKVPYDASQEKIAKALESIYKQLWTNLEENERLEALRDSLLPKLMSGELKINEIDC